MPFRSTCPPAEYLALATGQARRLRLGELARPCHSGGGPSTPGLRPANRAAAPTKNSAASRRTARLSVLEIRWALFPYITVRLLLP